MKVLTEPELINLIKKKCINDLEKNGEYDRTDCTSKKYKMGIELKSRYRHYNELLIEYDKYTNVKQNVHARYINATPEGIFSFDLKKVPEPVWFDMLLPATTEFQNNDKILKKVGLLKINDAQNITNLLIN